MIEIPNWWEGQLPSEPCARIIRDSITANGHRMTTFEARFHRFTLAEWNTHTLFSRNSASSRAIPLRSKTRADGSNPRNGTIDRLEDVGPAYPIRWPKEQPGMQGADEEVDDILEAKTRWQDAMADAIWAAEKLAELGLHKSLCNRLIEPYSYHVATITAVDWEGFFAQRSWKHTKAVQPEFGVVATMMEEAMDASTPELVAHGKFHLPWIRPEEEESGDFTQFELAQISSARSARVSYMTHDGLRDIDADFDLYNKLLNGEPPHASPFQHPATPDASNEFEYIIDPKKYGIDLPVQTMKVPIVGNSRGYMQLRHIILGI